jgi:hypothetical protein
MEGIRHIDAALPDSEEEKLETHLKRKARAQMMLMVGLPTLAVAALIGYLLHLVLGAP